MRRAARLLPMMAGFTFGAMLPALAAPPAPAAPSASTASAATPMAAIRPAKKCLSDLRVFSRQMHKDGYWLNDAGYADPMGPANGAGMPAAPPMPRAAPSASAMSGYQNVRPRYDVSTLLAATDILGRDGEQRACEDVLAATRMTYKRYAAAMHGGKMRMEDAQGWRKQQIAAAQPVTARSMSFRSDELIGTEVRSTHQDVELGSVDDIVMSPHAGKIAYLVIARGGIFGIDEQYVAVPWADFRVSPDANLLVLDATKADMAAAPQAPNDRFAGAGHFQQESRKVDAYWQAHKASATPPTGTATPKL
ncbi:MAG: PRC-barrel domain-containing protein [Rhodospirillales bacterium]|nr:PRC-barrel domain-containing protein [Rhodospirillales bacterium]